MPADLSRIAVIGDHPPRKCGIATFTNDLCNALAANSPDLTVAVAAVNDTREGYKYPSRVRFQIAQNRLAEYTNAADFLNINNFDIVCVQHEFGIYGGLAGGLLLSLVSELGMPVVTTLHTILTEPDQDQRKVMDALALVSDRLVVMSQKAVAFLKEIYGVPEAKIALIPHGVPDLPFVDPNCYKHLFGVEGRKVILTFGLLSPNNGIEYVIKALPSVVEKHPDVVYIVLGATHPNVIREKGEEYRFLLQGLVGSLALEKHVIFHDRFVEDDELHAFLGSSDICVTPYLSEKQIVSGALSFCLGAGKAVVSTPYWYAQELLAEGRGVIVPFADGDAVADALLALLDNDVERHAMRKRAYVLGRQMVWSAMGKRYLDLFSQVRAERRSTPRKIVRLSESAEGLAYGIPHLNFKHLKRLTDSTGILQHAKYTVPDRGHGYCSDDNARALIVAVRGAKLLGEEARDLNELAAVYLSFLDFAFDEKTGRFHNLMNYQRHWTDDVGSEDCHARALWACAVTATSASEPGLVSLATRLFLSGLPAATAFKSPRAMALTVIGIHQYLRRFSGDVGAHRARERLSADIFDRFKSDAREDWPWPEETLAYMNARLPEALLLSGQWMSRGDMIETALGALNFLVRVQTSPEGCFEPVGNKGWYTRGGVKSRFDQQPVEAESTFEACVGAWHVTGDSRWLDEARLCYEWFLGRNILNSPLYDHATGGCRDGLQPDGVSRNEGAESTLAWLLAAITMEEVEAEAGTEKKNNGPRLPRLDVAAGAGIAD